MTEDIQERETNSYCCLAYLHHSLSYCTPSTLHIFPQSHLHMVVWPHDVWNVADTKEAAWAWKLHEVVLPGEYVGDQLPVEAQFL